MVNPSDEAKREGRADTRDVRADARDDRAGARDTRADVRDVAADDRDVRADTKDEMVVEREAVAVEKEDRVSRLLRYFLFLAFVLTVISLGNFARSFINQNATDDAREAAADAKEAAEHLEEVVVEGRDISQDTLDELRAIIARYESSRSSGASSQAVTEALKAIDRIEYHLCGGRCPEP